MQVMPISGQPRYSSTHQVRSLFFAGRDIKVMSYNVENFYRAKNGHRVKNDTGIKALAAAILKEQPDVLTLQEAGDDELMAWFNKTYLNNLYPNIASSPVRNQRGMQRVVMMSKKDIQIESVKTHLPEVCKSAHILETEEKADEHGIDSCWKRDVVESQFKTASGYVFTVLSAHLKSMRGGEKETMPIRLHDARIIGNVLRGLLAKDPEADVFVTGDMNTNHTTQYGKPVIEALSLTDDNDPDNDMSEAMLKDGKEDGTHNGGRKFGTTKLDYIFMSPGLLNQFKQAYVSGDFSKHPWANASDHRPIVTVIEEPDAATGTTSTTKQTGKKLDKVA